MASVIAAIGSVAGAGSTLSTIGNVLGAVSAVGGAFSAISGANSQADVLEFNAAQKEQTALDVEVKGSQDAALLRRQRRQQQAKDEATFAQSGALSGSSLDVLYQNQVYDELDALTVENNANVEATGIRANASIDRGNASQLRTAGYLSAASKLAGGVGGFIDRNPLSLGRRPATTSSSYSVA